MNKYRNVRTVTPDGNKHASKAESKRWGELQLLERAGEIRNLRRQVPYELAPAVQLKSRQLGVVPRKSPSLRYVADFVYDALKVVTALGTDPIRDEDEWATIVEDCKGAATEVYRIKRHLMKSVHNIDIFETQPHR